MFTKSLNLHDPSMQAAASGRLASIKWRVGLGVVYAAAGGLALQSVLIPVIWYALLFAGMAADYAAGRVYVAAKDDATRARFGGLFIASSALTQILFVSMTVAVAVWGGPTGRAISLLMAASSFVSGMAFLYRAPVFMLITLAPTALWLAVSPFVPITGEPIGFWQGALAMLLATTGFFIYAARSVFNNAKLVESLRSANDAATQRQSIAESKQAEAEESNRVKSEFLTTMTHELRTPLNAVIGYSEIIGEDMEAEGFKDLAQDATRITAAARHLLGLIDQILQLTNIDAGRSNIELDEVDVRKLIESAVEAVAEQAKASNNRLATRIAPDVQLANTDGEKLGVCVAHLLSNAVKFTSDGLVAISAEREAVDGRDWLRIAVSDTGIGMTEAEIVKAFQPFTQIDGSQTRAKGGMGLGLSITARTAQVLGGDVAAVSEPGTGSTFTLRVPMRFGQGASQFDEALTAHNSAAAAA